MIITIDGPSGVGKGTLSKKLAAYLNYAYLDTGLLFRAVAFLLKDPKIIEVHSEKAKKMIQSLDVDSLPVDQLRTEKISQLASQFGAIPFVRENLLIFQRHYISQHKEGVVLDGRDCGTVIAPEAQKKIFLTASTAERATRRYEELKERNRAEDFNKVLHDLTERDRRDQERQVSPLKPAHDAFILDTTGLSIDQVFEKALFFIKS